jgi:hypothetical protein
MELKVKSRELILHIIPSYPTVFSLAQQLLNQSYITGLDNHYSSPELFNLLNQLHTDAVETVRSNRKGLPEDVINCTLKKEQQFLTETNSWHSDGRIR